MNVVRLRTWVASDRGANVAFRVAVAVSLFVMYVVGRHQWFIRDDFAFIITRNVIRQNHGVADWLFTAQDGHWMTPPILVYRAVQNLFGIDSYWPYLIPTMALHLGTVLLVRVLCRRCGVSPWTTTLICAALLVFGSGWENIVFAIQITYNLSLFAFVAHVLLVDHDGPVDRRDVAGAAIGVVGVMSSGFGPFFVLGVAAVLAVRRRWTAVAVAAIPSALAFGWWYLFWYDDPIADRLIGPKPQVPAFAVEGVTAAFEGMVGIAGLGAIAAVAALGVVLWPRTPLRVRGILAALWLTVVVMFLGVGWTRIGFGVESAGVSRYRYMAAMLLAPSLGVAVDALVRWSATARATGRAVLGVSVVLNTGWLHTQSSEWAIRARNAQDLYELVAGSGLGPQAAPGQRPEEYNPDVTVAAIPYLVAEGAVTPRPPATEAELAEVRAALALP